MRKRIKSTVAILCFHTQRLSAEAKRYSTSSYLFWVKVTGCKVKPVPYLEPLDLIADESDSAFDYSVAVIAPKGNRKVQFTFCL